MKLTIIQIEKQSNSNPEIFREQIQRFCAN